MARKKERKIMQKIGISQNRVCVLFCTDRVYFLIRLYTYSKRYKLLFIFAVLYRVEQVATVMVQVRFTGYNVICVNKAPAKTVHCARKSLNTSVCVR